MLESRECLKCGGFLERNIEVLFYDSTQTEVMQDRCVNCGRRSDTTTEQNRKNGPSFASTTVLRKNGFERKKSSRLRKLVLVEE